MSLKVIGAGLPRTGTKSLCMALEELTGELCHHMAAVISDPPQVSTWRRAVAGQPPSWREFLAGYGAVTDWPASAFWRELSEEYPDALVVLSTRSSPEQWWQSFHGVIQGIEAGFHPHTRQSWNRLFTEMRKTRWSHQFAEVMRPVLLGKEPGSLNEIRGMISDLQAKYLTPETSDPESMQAAYEHHNEEVRRTISPDRLVEWSPEDGWHPLCEALGVKNPGKEFPHN